MSRVAGATTPHLRELIREATVDCYDEEEQATGLFTMIEESLALPFKTTVLGIGAPFVLPGTIAPDCNALDCRYQPGLDF